MAQQWTMETACVLLRRWSRTRSESTLQSPHPSMSPDGLEAWLLDQAPASLVEAERLLELISVHEAGAQGDMTALCQVGGAVRNDLQHQRSRVDVSFAPCASGPLAGRA